MCQFYASVAKMPRLSSLFACVCVCVVCASLVRCARRRDKVSNSFTSTSSKSQKDIKEMRISLSPIDRRWKETGALGRHLAILARINWSLLRMKMCYLFSEYVFMNARRVGSQSFARAFVFSFLLLTICSPTLLIYNNYRINRTVSFRVVKCC